MIKFPLAAVCVDTVHCRGARAVSISLN